MTHCLEARLRDKRLGTARLNLDTRTYEFWHGTLNFCRVNGYKTGPRAQNFSGPRLSSEVVSARQREGTRT